MLEKVQRVKEYIKAHIGEVVLISDIDIVVYDNFQHHLEMNDSTDIVFQKNRRKRWVLYWIYTFEMFRQDTQTMDRH
jgi:hypothetical protein